MTSLVSRARRDDRGGVAITFALAAVVLTGLVGAAVDYSRAASIQSNLQRAADGAALLAAKNHDQLSATTMNDDAATDYVRKTFSTQKIEDMRVKVTFLSDRVRVDANALVPTTIANVLGFRTIPVSGTSEALFGDTKVEIALVLDNTGSMADKNKLQTLKRATHNFLDKMQSSPGNLAAIRIAVVPFENDVNLGSLKSSWWVDPTLTGKWASDPQTAGCIWDRPQPDDARDTVPNASLPATLYSPDAERTSSCSVAPIVPLTGDFRKLHDTVDAMTASGTTNLTIGLAWGLHMLTPSEPISNAAAIGAPNVTKYIIFMTDGLNTKSRGTTDTGIMDGRTRAICGAIKTAGIQMFTAKIIEGNQSLLQDCATTPLMYYDVQDVSQLTPAFNSIYATITGTRIAR